MNLRKFKRTQDHPRDKEEKEVPPTFPPACLSLTDLLTYPALLWSLVECLRLKKILSSKWISMMIGSERSDREPILTMVLILGPMSAEWNLTRSLGTLTPLPEVTTILYVVGCLSFVLYGAPLSLGSVFIGCGN
jgi:hypothetical protein